jgi:hypothetical protein
MTVKVDFFNRQPSLFSELPAQDSPTWLWNLVNGHYFEPCPNCPAGRDSTIHWYDITDQRARCKRCAPAGHQLLQVRRGARFDVVNVDDIAALCDITGVEPYSINGKSVVYLAPRPQPGGPKKDVDGSHCRACSRSIHRDYCSLLCKLTTVGIGSPSESNSAVAGLPLGRAPWERGHAPSAERERTPLRPTTPLREAPVARFYNSDDEENHDAPTFYRRQRLPAEALIQKVSRRKRVRGLKALYIADGSHNDPLGVKAASRLVFKDLWVC